MEKISIRKDLFEFLKEPNYISFKELTISDKLLILFKVFILSYIGLYVVSVPSAILEYFGIFQGFEMKTNRIYESIIKNISDYKLYFLFMVIIIYPILEELTFRLSLTKFHINSIKISFSVFSGMIIYFLIGKYLWMPQEYYLFFLMTLFYMFLLSVIIYIPLYLNKIEFLKIENYWNKKPKIIFYAIAILFASLHIFNISIRLKDLIYLPLVLLPFFVFSLTFGYLRIRLGLLYSIALHVIINGFSFGLQELIKH